MASADGRLDRVRRRPATARAAPSHADDDGGAAGGLGLRRWRWPSERGRISPRSARNPAPAGDDGAAVDDALDAEARPGCPNDLDRRRAAEPRSWAPATMARAIGCSLACSTDAGEPQRLVGVDAAGGVSTSTSPIRPVVTVPVLSRTIGVDPPGRLQHLGPLITMPSWAPRPVPTSSAVGVASPRAHGQAMISTATAAVNAARPSSPSAAVQPEAEGADGQGDHDRHEHGRDPVGQALHLGLAGLGVLDQPGDLGQRRCRRRPGWPRHDEPAAGVDRGPGDGVAGPDLDGHALAGEQRGVDGRGPVLGRPRRWPPSRPGRTTNRSPTASSWIGIRTSCVIAFRTTTSLAPSSRSARRAAPDRRLALASRYRPVSRKTVTPAATSR